MRDDTQHPEGFDGDSFPFRDPLVDPELGMRIPEDQIDAMLDRELSRDQTRDLFRNLSGDPDAGRDLTQTEAMLQYLRRPVDAPDMTSRILDEVDRRRAWLPAGGVKKLTAWRLAAAVALMGLVAGGFVMQRVAPQAVALVEQPAPITDIARAMSYETADVLAPVQQVVRSIRLELAAAHQPRIPQDHVVVTWRPASFTSDAAADVATWLDGVEKAQKKPCQHVCRGSRKGCGNRDRADWPLTASALAADPAGGAGTSGTNAILLLPGR